MPPVLLGGVYLTAFFEVGPAMSTATGPAPLSYAELDAWMRLSGRDFAPWEVELFRDLSRAYCAAKSDGEDPAALPPWTAPTDVDRAEVAKRLRAAFSARARPKAPTPSENRSYAVKGGKHDRR